MKRILYIIFVAIIVACLQSAVFAQTEGDAILGVWESGSGKARIKIDRAGDKFNGRIVWLREPKDEVISAEETFQCY